MKLFYKPFGLLVSVLGGRRAVSGDGDAPSKDRDRTWPELKEADLLASGLVRELADMHGTGFGLTASRETVERETLEAFRSAKATLESKAPDELGSYRQFVTEIARSVGEPAGGGESPEGAAIEEVEAALR